MGGAAARVVHEAAVARQLLARKVQLRGQRVVPQDLPRDRTLLLRVPQRTRYPVDRLQRVVLAVGARGDSAVDGKDLVVDLGQVKVGVRALVEVVVKVGVNSVFQTI